MKSLFIKALPAVLAGSALIAGARAFAADPATSQDVQQQLQALQAKVAQLEAQQKQSDESTINSVLTDAQKRTQLLQTSGTPFMSGYDKGKFVIQSEDGKFSLSPSVHLQLRGVANYREEVPASTDGDPSTEAGFEIRRAKFGFNGKLFGDLGFKFVWATNRQFSSGSGNVFLEDAQFSYKLNDQFSLVGGQFKDPIHHEELVSSVRQMAADRSLVNELLGGGITDRVQGAGVEFTQGPVFATVILHDGINSDNTNFQDTPVNSSDWGLGGRLEYTAFGDKKAYSDFTAMGNTEGLLVIGVGGDVTGANSTNIFLYTVDAQWENASGLGLYGALLGRTVQSHGDADDVTDWGGLLQASYMVSEKNEVFGRYGVIDFDSADDLNHEITFGFNHYLYKHNAKLTLDCVILPNGSPADSGLGYLNSGDDFQIVGRAQFQIAL